MAEDICVTTSKKPLLIHLSPEKSGRKGEGLKYKFTIPVTLDGLNDYTDACRTSSAVGARMKKENEKYVRISLIRYKLSGKRIAKPVFIQFRWIEKNRRRDKDNIAFAKKFILDALVKSRVLKNDGWNEIDGFSDEFFVDPKDPRVEVTLIERDEDEKR